MKTKKTLVLMIVPCAAFVAGVAFGKSDSVRATKMENIFEQTLDKDFTPNREVIVSYVEVPPKTTLERHWHPGEEFHYVLEGKGKLMIDGQAPIEEMPGKVSHVPFKKMHTLVTDQNSIKVVVFRVHTQGEPVRYLEKGGSADR